MIFKYIKGKLKMIKETIELKRVLNQYVEYGVIDDMTEELPVVEIDKTSVKIIDDKDL